MRILVYDVAAESGGAMTVLQSFYEEFIKDRKNQYIFVLSVARLAKKCAIFHGLRKAHCIGCILTIL